MPQKEQRAVVKRFRDGAHNVLVATSIGEEGLDIGEVDLIICFDALGSATRTTQRYGRTGRKHDGRVVTLMTEGWARRSAQRTHPIARDQSVPNPCGPPKTPSRRRACSRRRRAPQIRGDGPRARDREVQTDAEGHSQSWRQPAYVRA